MIIKTKETLRKMEAIKNFFMEIFMLKEETNKHIGLTSFKSKKSYKITEPKLNKNKKDIKLSDLMKGNY